MKQRLVVNDLLDLTGYQRERLCQLWQPQLYDLVLAAVCTDVENDQYQYHEFVIGDIAVNQNYHGCSVYLRDLRSIPLVSPAEDQQYVETETEPDQAELFADDSFAIPAGQLDIYIKENCLPLLNIGQLIELLQRLGYGENYLELTIPVVPEQYYVIGRDGYPADDENEELCDLLWECLKEKL